MICLMCRNAEIQDGLASIQFERDEFTATIQLVPALICPSCGEAYLDELITTRVLNQAAELSHEGMNHMIQDYV